MRRPHGKMDADAQDKENDPVGKRHGETGSFQTRFRREGQKGNLYASGKRMSPLQGRAEGE